MVPPQSLTYSSIHPEVLQYPKIVSMKLIAKSIMKLIAKFTRVYGRITVILPLILTIGPLYLPWPSNDIGTNGGGRSGSGGIFVEANTSIIGIKYTHPVQGDRMVLVGDRMITTNYQMFYPLLKEWQKADHPRDEFDSLMLYYKHQLLGRTKDDMKVQYLPGTQGNHYAIGFTGDHDVKNKFIDNSIDFQTEGGRIESVQKLAKMVDDSYRESKRENGRPIDFQTYLGADSRDFYYFRVGGKIQVGRNEFIPAEPKVDLLESNFNVRSWQQPPMEDFLGPKYGGENRVVATDEDVHADVVKALGRHSRLHGHYPTGTSHSMDGYRLSQSENPVRIGHLEPGEEERIKALPIKTAEEIARKLVRKGWWDPVLEKQPETGANGRQLRQWRESEEEAMAREQRRQLPRRFSRPGSGMGGSSRSSRDSSSEPGGSGGGSSSGLLDSGPRRSPSPRASSRGRSRSSSSSSTGRNDEAPPVPTHLSRLERQQQRERSERENRSGSRSSSSRDGREKQRKSSRSGSRKRSGSRGRRGGGRGRRFG